MTTENGRLCNPCARGRVPGVIYPPRSWCRRCRERAAKNPPPQTGITSEALRRRDFAVSYAMHQAKKKQVAAGSAALRRSK